MGLSEGTVKGEDVTEWGGKELSAHWSFKHLDFLEMVKGLLRQDDSLK